MEKMTANMEQKLVVCSGKTIRRIHLWDLRVGLYSGSHCEWKVPGQASPRPTQVNM